MEILQQLREPIDAIFVAVGGGGLIGGIAAYVKRLRPDIRIIGVEPTDANAMERSLRAGRRIILPHVGLFADGVAVKQVGVEPFRLARRHVDEMILVDTDELCAAMKDVFEDTRAIVEPSAALGVAGAKRYVERERITGRSLVTVLCGANMNFDRLRFVAERADLGEAREAVFAATIPERPGSFKEFCSRLGRSNITEFNYRYGDPDRGTRLRRAERARPPGEGQAPARPRARRGSRLSISPTTSSRSSTCATWSVGRRRRRTRSCTGSSSRSGPAR